MQVFAATVYKDPGGMYKPSRGMWDFYVQHCSRGVAPGLWRLAVVPLMGMQCGLGSGWREVSRQELATRTCSVLLILWRLGPRCERSANLWLPEQRGRSCCCTGLAGVTCKQAQFDVMEMCPWLPAVIEPCHGLAVHVVKLQLLVL